MSQHQHCLECDGLLAETCVHVTDWQDIEIDRFSRIGRRGEKEIVVITRRVREWTLYCDFCRLVVRATEHLGRAGFAEVRHYHNRKDVQRLMQKIPGCRARRGVA